MTKTAGSQKISVKDLDFDRLNPRLAEYGVSPQSTDESIMEILWDTMDVLELVQSIAASGFFPHEPLIVAIEEGKKIVIEGNRRLAAVKLLLGDQLAKKNDWNIPQIPMPEREQLESLPVIIVSNRQDSWRYLGFKHVNGPAKWTSYAKAKYIVDVHRNYRIQLADIANQIGDRHHTVQRLYRGLMVLEQAERDRVYDREDRFRQRLAFSHLYTGLGYDGVISFIGLRPEDDETDSLVPEEKLEALREFLVWLYGSKKENRPPVIQSQNPDLRRLDAVLNNREAIAALRAGTELSKAFEISRPPTVVFEEALLAAKRELTNARALLTTGYDKSDALLRIAGTIAEMADDIYHEMERKKNPIKEKKRLKEEV